MLILALLLASPILVVGNQTDIPLPPYDPMHHESLGFDVEKFDHPGVESNSSVRDGETDFQKHSEDRIVRGETVMPELFPHQVWFKHCGGSLIASKLVLTAAHCVEDGERKIVYFLVRQGSSSRRGVAKFIIYGTAYQSPDYEEDTEPYINDIGVIILDDHIPTSFIIPIPNVFIGIVPLGRTVYITGYGSWGFVGNSRIPVPRTWNLQCGILITRQLITGRRTVVLDDNSHLPQSICYGDDGGPAMVERYVNRRRYWTVFGVASYILTNGRGPQCGGTGPGSTGISPRHRYSMFATLFFHRHWLEQMAVESGGGAVVFTYGM